MSTLREAAEKAIAKHDDWAAQMPAGAFDDPPSDAIDALRAELAKPDARPAPAEPQPAAQQELKPQAATMCSCIECIGDQPECVWWIDERK